MNDLKTFGFLFETLCIRDLRVFADSLNGKVYHYRDRDGQECDAVAHLRNGKYGLIEIKLGGDRLIEDECTVVPYGFDRHRRLCLSPSGRCICRANRLPKKLIFITQHVYY